LPDGLSEIFFARGVDRKANQQALFRAAGFVGDTVAAAMAKWWALSR